MLCPKCGGLGLVECKKCHGIGYSSKPMDDIKSCEHCLGSGKIKCKKCNGFGRKL